jgi:hypothetical protein
LNIHTIKSTFYTKLLPNYSAATDYFKTIVYSAANFCNQKN